MTILVKDGFSSPHLSPNTYKVVGTGRSTCRVCGEKIAKGEECVEFYGSHGDGGSYNAWKAVTAFCHTSCFS